jgi:hypothetical protein
MRRAVIKADRANTTALITDPQNDTLGGKGAEWDWPAMGVRETRAKHKGSRLSLILGLAGQDPCLDGDNAASATTEPVSTRTDPT